MALCLGVLFVCGVGLAGMGAGLAQSAVAADTAAQDAGAEFIDIGTGGPTGIYFMTGQGICRLIKKQAAQDRRRGVDSRPLFCVAPATGGSVDNIRQVVAGELDFGIAQSDVQYEAYNGLGKFEGTPLSDLRAVMALHGEPFHLVVGEDSGIAAFSDLAGKRVNIGNPTSGHRATMDRLMAGHTMTYDDLSLAAELNSSEQSQALCDGKIDAFVYAVGVPNGGVALATDVCRARVIPLDGTVEETLVSDYPYYTFFQIPEAAYATVDTPVRTIGARASLLTRADVPEDIVYTLTRIVMDNLSSLHQLHPTLSVLDPTDMIHDGLSAPLHPGAARYYREQGWLPQ